MLTNFKMITFQNIGRLHRCLNLIKQQRTHRIWAAYKMFDICRISSGSSACYCSGLLFQTNGHTPASVNTIKKFIVVRNFASIYNASSSTSDNSKATSEDCNFKGDADVSSWIREMNSDFGAGEAEKPASSQEDSSETNTSSSDSGNESDVESSSDSSLSDEENTDQAIAVEEIDYEEFFNEEEAIRHEELIEEYPLPIDLTRGENGVFDVEELVKVLEEENAEDICVIPVPPEIQYTDNLIIASARSFRQLLAMAELIQWIYKRKKGPCDPASVRIEGLQSKDWLALDLGNVVVHLMLEPVRRKYNIESLWLNGPENDPLCQEFFQNSYILNETGESRPQNQEIHEQSNKSRQQNCKNIEPKDESDWHSMQSTAGWHTPANPTDHNVYKNYKK